MAGEQFLGRVKMSATLFKTFLPASLLLYPANFMLASILTTLVTKSVLKVQVPLDIFQSLNAQFLFHSRASRSRSPFFLSLCRESQEEPSSTVAEFLP